jgi:hypothetical protein
MTMVLRSTALLLACIEQPTHAVVKLAVSKENGSYAFSGIKEGNYKVSASNVGYKTAFSELCSFCFRYNCT